MVKEPRVRTDTAPGNRLLCFGAHPDDCEIKSAGLAALWARAGGEVRFVALTDGSAGHHEMAGRPLAARRKAEAEAGARAAGADSVILDNTDGMLMPTLENRFRVIREIRVFRPDVIVCPRVNDYHPDHRYTGVLVQDACYLIKVPNIVPLVPVPEREPVVIFMSDRFAKPSPLRPDLVFSIDPVLDAKIAAVAAHESQVLEWLPWIGGYAREMPADAAGKRAHADGLVAAAARAEADRFREALTARYGAEAGAAVRHAEAYEISEYGAPLTDDGAASLFPF
jgi:N-acetylglucosamine malate deacetylase 1